VGKGPNHASFLSRIFSVLFISHLILTFQSSFFVLFFLPNTQFPFLEVYFCGMGSFFTNMVPLSHFLEVPFLCFLFPFFVFNATLFWFDRVVYGSFGDFCINNKPVAGDHQHVPAATFSFFHLIFIMPTTPLLQQH